MKILHTITCSKFDPVCNAYREFTRHLTRPRRLTYEGIRRMFSKGCPEYDADSAVCVCRVETAVYSR
jgi:hypothetical protein